MNMPDVEDMKISKGFIERRKNRRFRANEGTFVSPRTNGQKFWQIIDVSKGGLSFRYIPHREDLKNSSELNISTRDTSFSLERVPFRSVSDSKIADESTSSYALKRHGVKFGVFTPSQVSQLDYFIKNHTSGEA
jgi:hypothetical protein